MSNLGIEQVTITDSLAERAKTCTTVLAPVERIGAPIGEFQFPGDTQSLSGTSIRPNGSVLSVAAGYGDTPLHSIFEGTVENMDDLEDPDLYNYNIVLSAIPTSQNHRTKLTLLFDLVSNETLARANTTTHSILENACRAAGIPFGRCDLPSVLVYGNYEVIRRNVCEIADDLCQPFNQFDYKHYFVRVSERDGLSIIGIDYTQGGEVENLHELVGVEQKTRAFARYMPDNRIGTSDVLLTGADIYSDDPAKGGDITITGWKNAHHTYHTDSRDVGTSGSQWTESDTDIDFLIQVVNNPNSNYDVNDADIDTYIEALAAGQVANIIIVESNVSHTLSRSFDAAGLTQSTETWYTYETKKFPMHIYKAGERASTVLTYDETLTNQYPDGGEFSQTLVKRWYGYSESGVQNTTVTTTYSNDGRDNWVHVSTETEEGDSPNLTNAAIQFYVDKANRGPDFTFNPSSQVAPKPAVVIGKYQLLNGSQLKITDAIRQTIQNAALKGYDPTSAQFDEEQREKRCFQVSVPYMGYDGLSKLYAMCLRQKELENAGAYWESVKATATIDTSPAAGESILASGSSGICDVLEHTITSDVATTSVSMRRLVVPKS